MRKYKWSLLKTLEFLNSRRPDLEIRVNFIQQLSDYENRLKQRGFGPETKKWNELAPDSVFLESEELLLRNTFLNSKTGIEFQRLALNARPIQQSGNAQRLKWVDLESRGKTNLSSEGRNEDDLVNLINPP
jgi:hypothetical protein